MKNQNKTDMTKAMGPFKDSHAPSQLSGFRIDVPSPSYSSCIPLFNLFQIVHSVQCIVYYYFSFILLLHCPSFDEGLMITHRYLQASLKHKCLSLKITKRLSKATTGKKSEAVNTRRSDNALAKIKTSKGQTTIYKTIHIKLTNY